MNSLVVSQKEKIKVFLLLFSCAFIKPTYFGIHLTSIGLLISLIAVFWGGLKFHISSYTIKMLLIIFLSRLYFIGYQLLTGSTVITNQLKALFSIALFFSIFHVGLSSKNARYYFIKIFINVMVFFVISYIITFVLSLAISIYKLEIIHYNIPNTDYELNILFPFTPAHIAVRPIAGIRFPRLHCFFRESGITQLFFYWLAAMLPCVYGRETKQYKIRLVLLLSGAFFCMSTVGTINLLIFVAMSVFKKNNIKLKYKLLLIIFLFILAYAIINLEGFRLSDINALSYQARIGNFKLMINEWKQHILFGVGYTAEYTLSTGLAQMLNRIGLFGVVLYLSPFFYGFYAATDKWLFAFSILPCIITILGSQPIIDAPIVYLLLLFYDTHKKPSRERKKLVVK